MGFGLYLVWPALYSTVTDSYRLSRAGRLRTDLGGVYFNAVFIAGMNIAYLNTGSPWLLVAIVMLHFETVLQFLPMIRLDGYYILSDLVGVPDLFSFMGPVLSSMIRGRANPSPRAGTQTLGPPGDHRVGDHHGARDLVLGDRILDHRAAGVSGGVDQAGRDRAGSGRGGGRRQCGRDHPRRDPNDSAVAALGGLAAAIRHDH
jgi:hypothetical protein